MEWFKNTFRSDFEEINDVRDWEVLKSAAIYRKHTGDLDGAIDAMVKAISLTRPVPNLAERTASMLNYLAADLYLAKNAIEQAEEALRESIELTRFRYPDLLADNLWVLGGIQNRKGERQEALASAEEARRLYQQQGHSYGVKQAEGLIERIKNVKVEEKKEKKGSG
jgi:tetratricopeptide (TPR) repeat protein